MKNRNLLITIAAVALTAITFNATATGLLSPRAAGNQITTVTTTANGVNLAAVDQGLASPRTAANRTVTVAGTAKEINPAMTCSRNMTASPKAVQACAANPAAAMPCCTRTVAAAR